VARITRYAVALAALAALPAGTARAQSVYNYQYQTKVFSPSVVRWPNNSVTQTLRFGQPINASGTIAWKKIFNFDKTPVIAQAWVGNGGVNTYYSPTVAITNVRTERPGSFGVDATWIGDFSVNFPANSFVGQQFFGIDFYARFPDGTYHLISNASRAFANDLGDGGSLYNLYLNP
jgi:hypothetical protein